MNYISGPEGATRLHIPAEEIDLANRAHAAYQRAREEQGITDPVRGERLAAVVPSEDGHAIVDFQTAIHIHGGLVVMSRKERERASSIEERRRRVCTPLRCLISPRIRGVNERLMAASNRASTRAKGYLSVVGSVYGLD